MVVYLLKSLQQIRYSVKRGKMVDIHKLLYHIETRTDYNKL